MSGSQQHPDTAPKSATAAATAQTQPPSHPAWVERVFHVAKRGSTVGTEVRGGLVSFVAMAYIVILNPLIIGGFSPDQAAVDVAGGFLPNNQVAAVTALTAGVMTILFGFVANLPFGLAAGLGVNSFLAVSVVGEVTWPEAMGLVVINGIVITILSLTGLRTMIFESIPQQLKTAITVGIGLFIAFIGFVDSGLVRSTGFNSPPVQLGEAGSVHTWPVVMFVVSLIIIGVLMARKVKGALLIGIVASTIVAMILEAVLHLGSSVDNPGGWGLSVPQLPSSLFSLPDLSLVGNFDFGAFARIGYLSSIMLIFTLFFTSFFDAMGTMTGLAKAGGLADEKGNFPRLKSAMVMEGVAVAAGGVTSGSANTVFVDSAAGVGEGARTGLASVVTGALFLLAMFFSPLTTIVPAEVASAALVAVGSLMVSQIKDIDWTEYSAALPVFLTITVMPLTYSIANGIGVGFISWVLVRSISGKARHISPLLWVVSLGFAVYFARGPLQALIGG
ncbi:NCS2 family permease [Pseudoclavibacter sp. 13-3]|uniref:NCS2 family permease n=1 Tax=Pseudoclavibacter sp. 13-3 TaxID=2901228 RepID=UPI001E38A2E9|nr:NCS2 family permease [Pseudoclavibacter sp. 13-3]MCD7100832.1 NCS2 family permease [Pseudoclavibacter sp. 13-3]